jgi:hypothetical protein
LLYFQFQSRDFTFEAKYIVTRHLTTYLEPAAVRTYNTDLGLLPVVVYETFSLRSFAIGADWDPQVTLCSTIMVSGRVSVPHHISSRHLLLSPTASGVYVSAMPVSMRQSRLTSRTQRSFWHERELYAWTTCLVESQ